MTGNQHTIRRLSWQIEGNGNLEPDKLLKDIESYHDEVFDARFSELADAMYPEDKITFIPELRINVNIDQISLNQQFTAEVIKAIKEELENYQTNTIQEVGTISDVLRHFAVGQDVADQQEITPLSLKIQQQPWFTFEFFLSRGYLPWWSTITIRQLEQEILEGITKREKFSLSDQVHLSSTALHRLFYQFSEHFIEDSWIHFQRVGFSDLTKQFAKHVTKLLKTIKASDQREYLLKLKVSQLMMHWSADNQNEQKQTGLLYDSMRFILPMEWISSSRWRDTVSSVWNDDELKTMANVLQQSTRKYLAKIQETNTDSKPEFNQHDRVEKLAEQRTDIEADIRNQSKNKEFQTRKETSKVSRPDDQFEGIYSNQLGLVILHPFLEAFFADCNVLDQERSFKSKDAHQLAIHMLYFLSTGKENPSEDQLTFIKVLCGYPMEDTLIKKITLSETLKDKAVQLLNAVLKHWQALKSTDIDSLREAFLQREGKMIQKESSWEITVEQKSIDILLARLPWGISPIYLPWNAYSIQVNWT